jgi:alpha,alpha-trehalase
VERHTLEETDFVTQLFDVQATVNDPVRVEKIVSLYTSRDPAITECGLQAKKAVHSADSFGDLLQSHVRTWEHLWHRFGIELQNEDAEHQDRVEMVVHLYIFHVLQSNSKPSRSSGAPYLTRIMRAGRLFTQASCWAATNGPDAPDPTLVKPAT